jgi:hypothetical protein
MKRFTDNSFRNMFIAAALWNAGVSIPAIAAPGFLIPMIFGESARDALISNTYGYIAFNCTMFSVFLFGIGYYIVSRDITRNRGIVYLGIILKSFFFFYMTYHFILGNVTFMMQGVVAGDLLFVILFFIFLHQTKSVDAV